MSARPTRWNDLDPRLRRALVAVGVVDAGLRAAALTDLARRPREDVRGSKRAWGWALALVSSAGILPIIYLLRGRRTGGDQEDVVRSSQP